MIYLLEGLNVVVGFIVKIAKVVEMVNQAFDGVHNGIHRFKA